MVIVLVPILLVIVLAVAFISGYNTLIKYKNWIDESWAQIDVQLKRRYDLIPNLLETVKAYAKHEQETLEKVIQARNQLAGGGSREEQIAASDELSGSLKNIFALSESYPTLQSNQNFMMLQEELSSTENKIAYARQLYNSTVAKYNTKIETIPTNIIASLAKHKKVNMLEAKEEERANVKVSF